MVRVTDVGESLNRKLGCIIYVTRVDPSPVMVECNLDEGCFFMIWDSGYDICRYL